MNSANQNFDVFLSHSSAQKSWVEMLARNLQKQGISVWLDKWQLKGGDRWTARLQEGLDQSSMGLLVVTDEAQSSGWIQDEYDTMLRHKNDKRSTYRILPLLLSSSEGFPFLGNVQAIDFRDHDAYRRHFYELICTIRGEAPDPHAVFDGELELPRPPRQRNLMPRRSDFLDDLFNNLEFTNPLALLLAQHGMDTGPVTEELLKRAEHYFGAEGVIHLVPPVTGDDEQAAYFCELGRQCELEQPVSSPDPILNHLRDRMEGQQRLCLLLSNYECGPYEARQSLARMLRLLVEQHPGKLRVIFRGSERLFALTYDQGDISALTIAKKFLWPELSPADLQALYQTRHGGGLEEADARAILDVSGGEPRLASECCDFHQNYGPGYAIEDLAHHLRESDTLWDLLWAAVNLPGGEGAVREALGRDDLGPGVGYPLNHPERRLFWRNLLTRRQVGERRRLVWRSESLRRAGLDILECA